MRSNVDELSVLTEPGRERPPLERLSQTEAEL